MISVRMKRETELLLYKPERISERESCFASEAFSAARTTIAAALLYRSRTALTMSYLAA